MKLKKWYVIYIILVIIRFINSLSPGYIHPDEWFQSGEVLIGHLLKKNTVRTWEFDPSMPCRSMASIYLLNFPLVLAIKSNLFDSTSTGFYFFIIQRLSFLALSFVPDICIASIFSNYLNLKQKQIALILYAGSGATLSFAFRPFSNNVESTILFASLTIVANLVWKNERNVESSILASRLGIVQSAGLGALGAIGLFSRFTFAVFAVPTAINFLLLARREASHLSRPLKFWIKLTLPCLGTFLCVSAIHILFDTLIYRGMMGPGISQSYPYDIKIVPLNALRYNLVPSNLAQHGLHPRWLHLVVNAPMILGIYPWFSFLYLLYAAKANPEDKKSYDKDKSIQTSFWSRNEKIFAQTIIFAIFTLSIQPHQEPRFLLPLVAPTSLLLGMRFGSKSSRFGISFSSWIVFGLQSVLVSILFCQLHHAGIIPSMLQWQPFQSIQSKPATEFLFWRSFMPPSHLMLPYLTSLGERSNIQDLSSISSQNVLKVIESIQNTNIFIFAPLWAIWKSKEVLASLNVTTDNYLTIYPTHLDLDHLQECHEMWREGYSITKAFAYGIWHVAKKA